MAHEMTNHTGNSDDADARRRMLLRAGLAFPIGSAALLAACGGGGSDTGFAAGVPVAAQPAAAASASPPPSEFVDAQVSNVSATPEEVPVPPVEPPPAKAVDKAVKNVRILNLQTPTYTPPAAQRKADESMQQYTQRAMQEKFVILQNALTKGMGNASAPFDLCYFVVPEFFWNVNWDALNDEADIKAFSDTCVVEVQKHVRALIALFPKEQYGKLALLPGTAQVLKKQIESTSPTAGLWGDQKLPGYEALNYVLVIDNFSAANPDGSRPIAMWPKRSVSHIDFDTYGGTEVTKNNKDYWKVRLGKLSVLVLQQGTTVASYYADGKMFKGFDNDPLGGVPFGVDVCLDYALTYTDKEYLRMSQIEDTNYILDFLIACGMSVSTTHKYLPSVQYIIRNDGMSKGTCEIFKLSAPIGRAGIETRAVNLPVPEAGPPLDLLNKNFLHETFIEIHPLWQYPSTDIPTENLPSPLGQPPAL